MEYPRSLSLDQSCSLSTLTQSAQSFIPTVASTTTFGSGDTQLYITLSSENFSHSMQKLKNCLNDIQNFMFANKLKLNPDKTEFILIGSQSNRNQLLPHFPINILGNQEIRSRQHKVSGTSEWCSTLISISQTMCHRSLSPLEYMRETST